MAEAQLRWRKATGKGDVEAAAAYLGLVLADATVTTVVARIRRATTTLAKAKDLARASGLKLLPREDPDVLTEIKRLAKGKAMSPILLLRGGIDDDRPLVIADGYHRICASYHLNQHARVPCRVVDLP